MSKLTFLKKYIIAIGIIVCAFLLFSPENVKADNFNSVDANTSDAGASDALRMYYASNPSAEYILRTLFRSFNNLEKDETKLDYDGDVSFRESKYGVVCAEGSLNVREDTSVFSNVLTMVWRKTTMEIVGEKRVNGITWYKVRFGDIDGYVASQFIKFDENEINTYFEELHARLRDQAVIPKDFEMLDDYSFVSDADKKVIEETVKQIRYSLKNDYPQAAASNSYINMYSILIYLMENYSKLSNIANNYGLQETKMCCDSDLETIEYLRETLQNTTGQTDEDFQNQIVALQKERAAKVTLSLGEQIANYAAQFVNVLPYVWGGASLTHGADCSGFACQIYAKFGLVDQRQANIHGYDSSSMRGLGRAVSVSEIQPGDLVCYNGHVGIYYGNGCIVHEPSPGRKCSIGSLYMLPIVCVRRLH